MCNHVLIVYPPGGYGTFVEWCLNYFSGTITDHSLPFTDSGNSHLFVGNFLDNDELPNWNSTSQSTPLFARTHACIKELSQLPGYTAQQYVDQIQDTVSKIVLINVPRNAQLLVHGNSITKSKEAIRTLGTFSQRVIKEFKEQFGVIDSCAVPTWQLREMMSYWHQRRLGELYTTRYQKIIDPRIINVSVRDLVDNFEHTISWLFDNLHIRMHNRDQIATVYQKWIRLQKFVNSDKICQDIVHSAVNNIDLEWKPLHLFEEAVVQWQLRDLHQMDMLCYNLNEFPLSTRALKKVLINV